MFSSAPLPSLLLFLMATQLPEEDAFSVFVKIMETHKLREVFKPNMSEVAVYFYQLEKLIEVRSLDGGAYLSVAICPASSWVACSH